MRYYATDWSSTAKGDVVSRSGSEPVGNRMTHVGKSGDGDVCRRFEERSASPSLTGSRKRVCCLHAVKMNSFPKFLEECYLNVVLGVVNCGRLT